MLFGLQGSTPDQTDCEDGAWDFQTEGLELQYWRKNGSELWDLIALGRRDHFLKNNHEEREVARDTLEQAYMVCWFLYLNSLPATYLPPYPLLLQQLPPQSPFA